MRFNLETVRPTESRRTIISSKDERDAEKLRTTFWKMCAESDGEEVEISARAIAVRAGVDPDRAVHLLFELTAAKFLRFERSDDADPDKSVALCPDK